MAAVPAAQIVADEGRLLARPSTVTLPWSTITISELRGSEDLLKQPADSQAAPDDLACLFATSGTTGTPKLVGLSHRAVLFDVGRQTNDLYLGPDDRIDLLGHPSFSASLASIFTALLTGAELHILDRRHQFVDLDAWLTKSGITVSTMTVSTLRSPVCDVAPRRRAAASPVGFGGRRAVARQGRCGILCRVSPPRACCKMPWRPQKRGPMPSTSCPEGPPRMVRCRSAGPCSPKTSNTRPGRLAGRHRSAGRDRCSQLLSGPGVRQ